jgi:membrane protease YdiL (CAAX protease family)
MIANRPPTGPAPFPDVRSALLLTIGAMFAGLLVGVLFFDLGPLAAEGIGTALGIGAVASHAARRVAEPQAARIGLAPLPWRAWPLILCLVPAVLIASELDNFAYDVSPKTEAPASEPATAPEPATKSDERESDATDPTEPAESAESAGTNDANETTGTTEPTSSTGMTAIAEAVAEAAANAEPPAPIIDPNDPFSLMEASIVVVGIAPVINEFLFRGVIQQGLVSQVGLMRGVTLTALLWTMLHPPAASSLPRFAVAWISSFAFGWLLGMVRVASGSILGSTLLASLWASVGLASLALQDRIDVPGMNVDGTHLPAAVTVASVGLVAWTARRVFVEARARVRG